MQKEIKVVDYIRNMAESIAEYYYDDEEQTFPRMVIYAQALVFLKTFGLEISTNVIKAYDEIDCEYSEEYYRAVFVLYKNMTNGNVTAFIDELKSLVAKEERKKSLK